MIYSWQNITKTLYLIGLAGLLVAMPLSNFFMSFFQFFILGAWLLQGGFIIKWKNLIKNKPALVLASLFLLHIVGLLWTTDYKYAFNDIRIKLPLLMLPVVVATGPKINQKTFDSLLLLFATSVAAAGVICSVIYFSGNYNDVRDISVFISHIRFSLLICLSILILARYAILRNNFSGKLRIYSAIICLWLLYVLYILDSLTGFSIIIITGLLVLAYFFVKNKNRETRIILASVAVAVIAVPAIYIYSISREFVSVKNIDFSKLENFTPSGKPYIHDTLSTQRENGNYVYIYINVDEMREGWNKRSQLDYDGFNLKGQKIQDILIRFLSSKGYRKDAEGVKALTDAEIGAVERGITNYLLMDSQPFRNRIYQVLWEYQHYCNTGNASGHSVMQRIEFLKAAMFIIRDNWEYGTGTGDLQLAFNNQYEKMHSKLGKEWRLRAHNQYVTMFIAFGVFGFLWFMITLIYPPLKQRAFKDYFFFVFFVIVSLSMLNEDTLETQAGVTFFAVFFSYFLFIREKFQQS